MTPQESREEFIEGILSEKELAFIREINLYQDYVEGHVSVNTIFRHLRDQAE